MITNILTSIDSVMYYPILIIVLAAGGIWFTIRTKGIQIRFYPEAWKVITEKPQEEGAVSSFQALMVSTASRVGTGNIIGVATAICLGGPGAVFWMWILAILGSASAFIETTLAQIYKKHNKDGAGCYGGPEHYIRDALHCAPLAVAFVIFLLLTYGFGFNMLCAYNLQSTFSGYSFYDPKITPIIIGAILAGVLLFCLMGGGKRIVHLTEVIVPIMGFAFIAIALFVFFTHARNIPGMFVMIFRDAFNFKAIGSGLAGSCMVYGIKRGLYSNEAGVGSAPHAASSADVSHPAKQGLVAVVSVSIDTLFLCTATAFMCLSTGVTPTAENAGAPYVQACVESALGAFGPIFITVAMVLFAFTTLIGNLYYVNTGLTFLNHGRLPGKKFMIGYNIVASLIVFIGAISSMDACWALADITMGGMAIINIPCCIILGKKAFLAARDYTQQKKSGKNPVFHARDIGLNPDELDYWGDVSPFEENVGNA